MKLSGQVRLDYGDQAPSSLLKNLSGAAAIGDFLWTVSDEGRAVERLKRDGDGFRLDRQFALDDLIEDIPRRFEKTKDELDLEAVAVADGRLWLCGSHSNAREKVDDLSPPSPVVEIREARSFLASFALTADGALADPRYLPFTGEDSLRQRLAKDQWLAAFLAPASKEGGLDIEGLAVRGDRLLLGLRGPVIEGRAIIIALRHQNGVIQPGHSLHFLDLKGLAIRDLKVRGSDILVLAGPSGVAEGPYRLHLWRPDAATPEAPELLFTWPYPDDKEKRQEKPEGLCVITWEKKQGFLVLYDSPANDRVAVKKGIYHADLLFDD